MNVAGLGIRDKNIATVASSRTLITQVVPPKTAALKCWVAIANYYYN